MCASFAGTGSFLSTAMNRRSATRSIIGASAANVSVAKADGFRQVSYKGTVGWAATPYLN